MIFVDTSAFYSLLDSSDQMHRKAKVIFDRLAVETASLHCSNYIVVETAALIQKRLGVDALRVWLEDFLPVVNIQWVNEFIHNAAIHSVLSARRKDLSLVDCTTFEIMRMLGIKQVFAFDKHFSQQGFEVLR